jgi:hypothetical protein
MPAKSVCGRSLALAILDDLRHPAAAQVRAKLVSTNHQASRARRSNSAPCALAGDPCWRSGVQAAPGGSRRYPSHQFVAQVVPARMAASAWGKAKISGAKRSASPARGIFTAIFPTHLRRAFQCLSVDGSGRDPIWR